MAVSWVYFNQEKFGAQYELGNKILACHGGEKRNEDSQRNCGGILKNDSMVAVKMNMG